ncbi:isochorismatase [Cupriavidus sp. WKF15]|uniref:isochorismatase n=1 Tax=Cupriavidus sp. WKF15 TaxID=3032282 RepID=UPI0023E24367|nr:isochorismatase [Cupriavidus sp. WKF15]WER44674.1 isochorismatase [Cupriavidus sp. WKF15]
MNPGITPFTVSVYPIQQEPGVWFANYMISEYKDGAERIVANVSMRHATHHTEAKARQAARHAGESAVVAHMRLQPSPYRQATTPSTSPRGIH